MTDDLRARVLAFLQMHSTLTLATEHAGKPWATAVFYANDAWTLYFVSDPKTRHAQHLRDNACVAATIQADQCEWRAIQGIQLEGTCVEITALTEVAHALTVYTAKYPFIADLARAPQEIGAAMTRARFHKIVPTWIRLIDNTRGMGHKEEIRLGENEGT
jgi:hypothetical protein